MKPESGCTGGQEPEEAQDEAQAEAQEQVQGREQRAEPRQHGDGGLFSVPLPLGPWTTMDADARAGADGQGAAAPAAARAAPAAGRPAARDAAQRVSRAAPLGPGAASVGAGGADPMYVGSDPGPAGWAGAPEAAARDLPGVIERRWMGPGRPRGAHEPGWEPPAWEPRARPAAQRRELRPAAAAAAAGAAALCPATDRGRSACSCRVDALCLILRPFIGMHTSAASRRRQVLTRSQRMFWPSCERVARASGRRAFAGSRGMAHLERISSSLVAICCP